MVSVKKAQAEDFEKIYPLLLVLDAPHLTKADWRQFFVNHWGNQENYFGYVLVDKDDIVGFLGVIFSNRLINEKQHKFCNLSTWVVKEKYRSASLSLLIPILKLKGYTFTEFTSSKNVYVILKKYGFKEFETKIKIVPFIPLLGSLFGKCSVELDKEKIEQCLNEKNLRIFRDHSKFKCFHLFIRSKEGECYILITKVRKRNLPFAQLHYISNLEVFLKYITRINATICWRFKVLASFIFEEYLIGHKIKGAITVKLRQPKLFKSDTLSRNEIDSLYSECIINSV